MARPRVKRRSFLSQFAHWLRSAWADVQYCVLPIDVYLDTDEQGQFVARVSYMINGQTRHVTDVAALCEYGYKIERGGCVYSVGIEDLEMLLAMRSVASEIRPTGEIVMPIIPPVLRYLRQNQRVSESPSSRETQVLDTPWELGANLDYDPSRGLIIQTGYRIPGQSQIVPASELEIAPGGQYARLGRTFAPLPAPPSPAEKEWLEKGQYLIPLHGIPEFFQRDLVLFQTEFLAVLSKQAARLQVLDLPPTPRVRISSNEPGWLDFQLDYVVAGHELSLEQVRSTEGQVIRPDAYTFVRVPPRASQAVRDHLMELHALETPQGYRIQIAQFASLEDFIEHIGGQREMDAAYRRFLDDLEGFEADQTFRLSDSAEQDLLQGDIRLRPYQRAGIHWLTWLIEHHLHSLLADDMGLGKTIQTAAALRHTMEKRTASVPSLIVCPKSVIRHWHRELKRCYPSLRVYEYIGSGRDRKLWQRSYAGVVISTYNTVSRDIESIRKTPLFFLVLDESTRIKNPQTKRARAVKQLNAAHRIALSGTPVENRPAELWSVFDFLMKGHLGAYETFQRVFEQPIIEGDRTSADWLGKRVGPFVLRRRKEQVATDLPPKIEMPPEWVELTLEQRRLYVAIQNKEAKPARDALLAGDRVGTPGILAILTKLLQVCDHPALVMHQMQPIENRSEKFDLALERVCEIVRQGEHVVLFSRFLGSLRLFCTALKEQGVSWVYLDGSVPLDERQRRIDAFNADQAQVALCSLLAVSHGVNLTAANHVIHFDRWWNPAVEDQATDRVHRIGQSETVFVHRILTMNTLEEKIATLLERKRGLSDRIMDAAVQHQGSWTREELIGLLEPLEKYRGAS